MLALEAIENALERALPQLAEQETCEKILLLGGGLRKQPAQRLRSRTAGAAAGKPASPSKARMWLGLEMTIAGAFLIGASALQAEFDYSVVDNGSYLTRQAAFPRLGYVVGYELEHPYIRKLRGLQTDFVIVDVGAGVQGLLHISEMGWARVSDASQVVKPGDEITVKVLRVDANGALDPTFGGGSPGTPNGFFFIHLGNRADFLIPVCAFHHSQLAK